MKIVLHFAWQSYPKGATVDIPSAAQAEAMVRSGQAKYAAVEPVAAPAVSDTRKSRRRIPAS